MKKFVILCLFIFCGGMIYSQAYEKSTQLNHKERFYLSKNKTLYINKNMPIYLKLCSSPDIDSDTVLLQSNRDKKEGKNLVRPYHFKSSGKKTMEIYQEESSKERLKNWDYADIASIFSLVVDANAPKTSLKYTDAPEIYKKEDLVIGKPIIVELFAKDDLCGVQAVFYSVNGDSFDEYEKPISFLDENAYHLSYYSVDNVGNVEKVETKSFYLDTTAPVTQFSVSEEFHLGNVYSPKAKIYLESYDNYAGVKEMYYEVSASGDKPKVILNGFYQPAKPISISSLAEGTYQLVYYAIDKVGNKEVYNQSLFMVDATAPPVSAFVKGDYEKRGGKTWISRQTLVELIEKDTESDFDAMYYNVNNGAFKQYAGPFPVLQSKKEDVVVSYYATDRIGNKSATKKLSVNMDLYPPETQLKINAGRTFEKGNVVYINSKTKIEFIATDKGAGVETIYYIINGGKPQAYKPGESINTGGANAFTVNFFAIDKLHNIENVEKASNQKVFIKDNEPPKIFHYLSDAPTREIRGREGRLFKKENDLQFYARNSKLILGANDRDAGVKSIQYSINGGPANIYEEPIQFDKPGVKKVVVEAIDNVGMKSRVEFQVVID